MILPLGEALCLVSVGIVLGFIIFAMLRSNG